MSNQADAIFISLIDGARLRLTLPREDDDEGELDVGFARASVAIASEYRQRRARRKTEGPSIASHDWLLDVAYRFLPAYIATETTEVWARRIGDRRHPQGRTGAPKKFQIGLAALFAHAPEDLGSRYGDRFGKQLWTAYRHYIPPALLIGFIRQFGSDHVRTAASSKDVEPSLRDFVIEQCALARLRGEPPDLRGKYKRKFREDVVRYIDQLRVECG
jgi:hypothetical protein